MITDISSINEFNDIINKNQSEKLLIDFYASWCKPCKKLSTILSECNDKYTNFTYISVDTDKFEELTDEFDKNLDINIVEIYGNFPVFKRGCVTLW